MALKTGLEGKPWYIGLAIGLLAGGVIFALLSWQFLAPKRDAIAGAQARLAELEVKIQQGKTAQSDLERFREEVRQLELELDKLLRILPARRNTPDLLRRIRSLAEQGDFSLKRFTPGLLIDKEFFSEWPIAVSLEGNYHNLALFFDRVSRFSRIINIEDLTITALPRPTGEHTIAGTFTAKTFVYKEQEPETPPADSGGPAAGGPAARLRSGGGGEGGE